MSSSQEAPDRIDLELLQRIIQRVASRRGQDYFRSLAAAISDTLSTDFVAIGERLPAEDGADAMIQAVAVVRLDDRLEVHDQVTYRLPGPGCQTILDNGDCLVVENLPDRLPDERWLNGLGIKACIGVPLLIDGKRAAGMIGVAWRQTLDNEEAGPMLALLQILAAGAAIELDRQHIEERLKRTRRQADQGLNHSPIAMLITNTSGHVRRSNRAFLELSGYFHNDIVDWDIRFFFPESEKALISQCLDNLVDRIATHLSIESKILDWQYRTIDVKLDCYSLRNDDDSVRSVVVQMEDITARKRAAREVAKLLKSIESSPVATVITDENAIIEYVNPRFTELTGFSAKESIGQKTNINASGQTPPETYGKLWQAVLDGQQWHGELLNRRKDGSTYWARTTIFPILDEQGGTANYVSLQEDISESRRLTHRLQYEATHDQLTGLINRREFERRLAHAVEEASIDRSSHALCFMDLDRFKVVNDISGHFAGDAVLTGISRLLLRHVRAQDTAARLGGDEFALILRHCDIAKARQICEQIRDAITAMHFVWEERIHTIGVSIGMAIIDSTVADTAELLRQVDAACYSAKENGRNRVVVYDNQDPGFLDRRQQSNCIPELEAALQGHRLQLFVQPIIPLQRPGSAPVYEVLVRMPGREGGLVMPGHFLPAAERYGLAPRIDHAVFDMLYSMLTASPDLLGQGSAFSVNLSGRSFSDPALLEHIIRTIAEGPLPADRFQFEITETAAVTSIVEAVRFMEQLREVGSRIALDDFGRGLSSFAYLKTLPVDILKIDGLFVRNILQDFTDYTVLKMISELAHSLDIETVAECIESAAVLDGVKTLGIDHAQGFHIARPFPIADLHPTGERQRA